MSQPTPTPIPDHGTGWGLLFLFIYLYGIVVLLGIGTVVAIVLTQFDRQLSKALHYLVVAILFLALGLSGFIILVAGTAQQYDVVALLLLIVVLPLTLSILSNRGKIHGRMALLTHAAIAWSLPFLVGFGVIAFVGTQASDIPPGVGGVLSAIIVIAGTILIDRLPFFPNVE